jgi:hypothetical protein
MSVAAVAGFVALVFLLYAADAHANIGNSDGASAILEGQAVNNGHLLLHGWSLSLDSFWTVDVLFYAAAIRFAGLRPGLFYAVPAVIAALVIVLAVLIARDGRRGGAAVAGGASAVALLAFPPGKMAALFLGSTQHIGTALYALVAFHCLRSARPAWRFAVAVLFLAAGMLGDLQMVAYGTAPVLLAGVAAMLRRRSWRGGIALLSAAVVAFAVFEIVKRIVNLLGGFKIASANPIAGRHQMLINVEHVFTYGFMLLGVSRVRVGAGATSVLVEATHLLAGVVMLVSVTAALIRLVSGIVAGRGRAADDGAPPPGGRVQAGELWRLDDLLVIATFGPVVTFVILAITSNVAYDRYLTAAVVFAAVLTGRTVARWWPLLAARRLAPAVAAAGIAISLCFVAGLGYDLAQPDPVQPAGPLASFLLAHQLTNGVGSYWSASITTVVSKGEVTVRPVAPDAAGRLQRYTRESAAGWYSGDRFQFFVYSVPIDGARETTLARKTWGGPVHSYLVGRFVVLVFDHPLIVGPDPPSTS